MSVEGSAVERLARLADEKDWRVEISREMWMHDMEPLGILWYVGVENDECGFRCALEESLESACSKALDRLKGET